MSGVIARWRPYFLSMALHAALVVVIIVMGLENWRPTPVAPISLGIEAVAVESAELDRMVRRALPPPPPPEPEPEPATTPTPKIEPKPEQVSPEAARRAEAARQAERVRNDAQARRAEEVRRAEAARRLAQELAAEERRRDEERRVRAERESALQRALSEEVAAAEAAEAQRAAAARAASLSAQWAAAIQGRVQRAWIRPSSARAGLDCRVVVTQAAGGTVIRAEVKECNGDEAVRQSLEAAVFRASPLPPPPEPSLFERTIELRFRPND